MDGYAFTITVFSPFPESMTRPHGEVRGILTYRRKLVDLYPARFDWGLYNDMGRDFDGHQLDIGSSDDQVQRLRHFLT